jgi:cold shock CspA family protein
MRTTGTVKWFNDAKGFVHHPGEQREGLFRPSFGDQGQG